MNRALTISSPKSLTRPRRHPRALVLLQARPSGGTSRSSSVYRWATWMRSPISRRRMQRWTRTRRSSELLNHRQGISGAPVRQDGRGYDRVSAEFDILAKAWRASNWPLLEAQRRPSACITAGIKTDGSVLFPHLQDSPRLVSCANCAAASKAVVRPRKRRFIYIIPSEDRPPEIR